MKTKHWLDEFTDLSDEQLLLIIQLDPVPQARPEPTQTAEPLLEAGLTREQVARVFTHWAEDLFAGSAFLMAYEFLGWIDWHTGSHMVLREAIKHSDVSRLCRLFEQGVDSRKIDTGKVFRKALAELAPQSAESVHKNFALFADHVDRGFALLLDRYLRIGELKGVKSCLAKLKRKGLTRHEKSLLAQGILTSGVITKPHQVWLGENASKKSRDACLVRLCERTTYHDVESLQRAVDRLKITLKAEHLVHAWGYGRNQVWIAREIVAMRGNVIDQHRLHLSLKLARRDAVMVSDLEFADECGCEIAEPLTPEELLVFVRRWRHSTARNAHHYLPLVPIAEGLAVARLRDPNAPANWTLKSTSRKRKRA